MPKFKVGDKVIIVGKITSDSKDNQGYMGQITHVYDVHVNDPSMRNNGGYHYKLDNRIICWQNDIELVELYPIVKIGQIWKTKIHGVKWEITGYDHSQEKFECRVVYTVAYSQYVVGEFWLGTAEEIMSASTLFRGVAEFKTPSPTVTFGATSVKTTGRCSSEYINQIEEDLRKL